MTDKVKELLKQLKEKSYKRYRVYEKEEPIVYPLDFFGFNFGSDNPVLANGGNLTPDYRRIITKGFDAIRQDILDSILTENSQSKKEYGFEMLNKLDECIFVCVKYREVVKESGNERLYNALLNIPFKPARNFFEACVFVKLCIYFLRVSNVDHIGLGRFDQYMYPYYKKDKNNGVSDEELFETLEAFFISLNFDTDLYPGKQKGDNGQSLVLGGFDKYGNSMYNELSDMCINASLELNLIDPKINLRVGKNTTDEIYIKATRLTKQGLGFPQYCNDDIVVPGLVKLGYNIDDAVDYVVAACWEFIIPGCGADTPNIRTMNFPLVVNNVIHEKLSSCSSFDELMQYVEDGIYGECERIISNTHRIKSQNPLLSIFIDGCIEKLTDVWRGGAKYTNYGCHGAGIANATDALAAVKMCVFDKKIISVDRLLFALDNNFENCNEVRNILRSCSKLGNNDTYVNKIACLLMSYFSKHMNNKHNGAYGIWRAGTGSAMEYIRSAAVCPATADGRKAYEPYSSSFSPSLDVSANGLLSIIQSFTQYDMTEIINGGPLTLEIHDSVFRNEIGIEKTAMLVKNYILLGGHQLQLNAINKEQLIDAQKNPEKYPNLIVRVWGWSGYFNELDLQYQNHIIRRYAHTL